VCVQFGLRVGPVRREIPSASLRAGSSLRLKSGSDQDDNIVEEPNCTATLECLEMPRNVPYCRLWRAKECRSIPSKIERTPVCFGLIVAKSDW
jgi:hypothetical protein